MVKNMRWDNNYQSWSRMWDGTITISHGLECEMGQYYLEALHFKMRRVWRYQSGNQNLNIQEEQTMAKRKSTKGQTTIYKTYI